MKLKELFSIILEKADNYMSNSCNKTSTLSNTAEIVENESRGSFTRLQLSRV